MMEKYSFYELIDKYIIEIPMLQRDYAYGRLKEKEKREGFLKNLKFYLEAPNEYELDFIYGSASQMQNEKKLILLDGQQRITTLFLLHWLFAVCSDNYLDFSQKMCLNFSSKFTYKTRISSSDFCDYLVTKCDNIKNDIISNDNISNVIKNNKNFFAHWSYDPTVSGMLNMLDDMYITFKNSNYADLYKKLSNGKIKFNFLDLGKFSLTNDLYIKMNSRGRSLTRFENIKSLWLMLYDEFEKQNSDKPEIINEKKSRLNIGNETFRSYVSRRIDKEWTDYFWKIAVKDIEDDTSIVDTMMLNFIIVLAINNTILNNSKSITKKSEKALEIRKLMSCKNDITGNTVNYEDLKKLFKENNYDFLFKIIDYFNSLCCGDARKSLNDEYKIYFDDNYIFNIILNDHKNDEEYEIKAKFFAFMEYLYRANNNGNYSKDNLNEWLRFICNIISNSYYLKNDISSYSNCLYAINDMLQQEIQNKRNEIDFESYSTIDKSQIKEELFKYELSKNSDEWRKCLLNAEKKLIYLEGRLTYPLLLANISNSEQSIDDFNNYVQKIHSLFDTKEGCKFENELIAALLSKRDYTLMFRNNKSLLRNFGRDNSWRTLLKSYTIDDKQIPDDAFSEVICDECFDFANPKNSLINIAKKFTDTTDWRYYIINCPEILKGNSDFEFSNDRCLRIRENEIDLLQRITITGYHAELFSLYYYYKLKDNFPLKYEKTKGELNRPYISCGKYKITCENKKSFEIWQLDDKKYNPIISNIAFENLKNELSKLCFM